MSQQIVTRLLHTGSPEFDPDSGVAPVSVPTVRTSTVRFASTAVQDEVLRRRRAGERISSYGRQGMDTHRALEDAIMLLEGGTSCFLAPSGMAAISLAFLSLAGPGDHVLVVDSAYAPVRILDRSLLRRLNVEVTYYRPCAGYGPDGQPHPGIGGPASAGSTGPHEIASLIRPNTRMIYAESPGSLLFEMQDIPAISQVARSRGIPLVIDNTWGSGYLYRPLELGADVSVIAATKYLAGHSDVMLGAVVARDRDIERRIHECNYALGLTVGPDDASLVLRGMRTLHVRLAQHERNALQVARHLAQHPGIRRVWYPALESDPGHALWKRDYHGANGLLSVTLNTSDETTARRFIDALKLFGIGYSWGGYESLVSLGEQSALAQHSRWCDGNHQLVRLHVGLEAVDDLIADLDQALRAAGLDTGAA